jgi:hypothetical protein
MDALQTGRWQRGYYKLRRGKAQFAVQEERMKEKKRTETKTRRREVDNKK